VDMQEKTHDFTMIWPLARTQSPVGRPHAANTAWHMNNVGEEDAMCVALLALQTKRRAKVCNLIYVIDTPFTLSSNQRIGWVPCNTLVDISGVR